MSAEDWQFLYGSVDDLAVAVHYQMSAEDWQFFYESVGNLAVAVHYQMSAEDGPVSLGSVEEPDPLQSVFLPVVVFCAPAQPHCYFAVGKEADLLVVPV